MMFCLTMQVCGKCRSQLNQCPTCRDKMCEMRNWAVERMAELLKYPCRNAGLGCPVATLLAGKNAHESTCPFRHYNCLFRTCSWTGFQQEMLPHLRSTHPLRFLEGAQQQIDVELNSPTLFYTGEIRYENVIIDNGVTPFFTQTGPSLVSVVSFASTSSSTSPTRCFTHRLTW